jgi:bifunctional UDP-N-acetylglucosamine pyrophosphorylase/glucosamine-1-phosphate N-acetyltransferase
VINTAVVLAGGQGKRLWPLTAHKPKPLIEIAGKSMIKRIVEQLKEAGIKRIVVVVNYREDDIRAELGTDVEYVRQLPKPGTATAVLSVKEHVDEDFLVVSGDHVLDGNIYTTLVRQFSGENTVVLKKVDEPSNYGVVEVEDGYIKAVEEKPAHPKSNLINTGIYAFTPEVFKALERVKLSQRGEYEITDVLAGMRALTTHAFWLDVGWPWQVLEANAWLLEHMTPYVHGEIKNCEIEGKVVVERGARLHNCVIRGNVYVGENVKIGPFAYIRGSTSLHSGAELGSVEIKNSVIGRDVKAKHFTYIGDSVIGDKVNVGAGTHIANLRFDNKPVKVHTPMGQKNSNRKKFGAVIGEGVKFGVNVSVMPGTVIEPHTYVMPGTVVKGWVQSNKNRAHQ